MVDDNFEKAMLKIAYDEAAKSPDSSTQNGAIIINQYLEIAARGYNRPSKNIDVKSLAPTLQKNKYYYMEHAERSAIFDAAQRGVATLGCTIVTPWGCCHDCARAIVECGITKLIRHKDAMEQTPARWRDSEDAGDLLLSEANVKIVEVRGYIGAALTLLDGRRWTP